MTRSGREYDVLRPDRPLSKSPALFSVGPFSVSPDGSTLQMREVHWATKYNVMFIDNPVGTGFSYTLNSKGFVTNQKEVGADLLSLLYQFYQSAHSNRH
jgi:carboxypeptidase C (cathepsin A)